MSGMTRHDRGMVTTLVLTLLVSVAPLLAQSEPIRRFSFGPASGDLAQGFTRVTSADAYTARRGYGFLTTGQIENDMCLSRQSRVQLDPLSRSQVFHAGTFRIDLPDGEYKVAVFTGVYSITYAPAHVWRGLLGEHWIKQDGQTLYQRPGLTASQYFAPDGLYFRSYSVNYRPNLSLWDNYLARYFPIIPLNAQSKDGHLDLAFSPDFSLNGLVVWPVAADAEGQAEIARLDKSRKDFVDGYYIQDSMLTDPPVIQTTAAQKQAGIVLFSRSTLVPIYPRTFPDATEMDQPLQALAARGEEVSVQMGCVPLRDLGEIRLSVSDLSGPGVIPSTAVELRRIRYCLTARKDGQHYLVVPKFLVPEVRVPGDAMVARGFCLTVKVPTDAPAGIYRGTVTMHNAQGSLATLPMQVRVLPFTLPQADIPIGAYHYPSDSTRLRPYMMDPQYRNEDVRDFFRRELQSDFALMRRMGCTYVSTSFPWHFWTADSQGNITANPVALARTQEIGDAVRDAGFQSFSCFGMGWSTLLNGTPGFLTREQAQTLPMDQIKFPDTAVKPAAALIRAVYDMVEQRRWPRFYFYCFDELANMGERGGPYGRELMKFLQGLKPLVGKNFTTIGSEYSFDIGQQELPHIDVLIPNSAFPVDQHTLQAIKDAPAKLWLYNMGGNRLSFGYYLWKIDAGGRAQWIYDWNAASPDPYLGLAWQEDDPLTGGFDCTIDPHFNPVPCVAWFLGAREGINDYRYLQLLRRKLAEHPQGRPAQQAQAVLEELGRAISANYLDEQNTWHPATYDYFRWQIAKAIMAFDRSTP